MPLPLQRVIRNLAKQTPPHEARCLTVIHTKDISCCVEAEGILVFLYLNRTWWQLANNGVPLYLVQLCVKHLRRCDVGTMLCCRCGCGPVGCKQWPLCLSHLILSSWWMDQTNKKNFKKNEWRNNKIFVLHFVESITLEY